MKKIEDFLEDSEFISWVNSGMPADKKWSKYVSKHPAYSEVFQSAINIILSQTEKSNPPNDFDLDANWNTLKEEFNKSIKKNPFKAHKK